MWPFPPYLITEPILPCHWVWGHWESTVCWWCLCQWGIWTPHSGRYLTPGSRWASLGTNTRTYTAPPPWWSPASKSYATTNTNKQSENCQCAHHEGIVHWCVFQANLGWIQRVNSVDVDYVFTEYSIVQRMECSALLPSQVQSAQFRTGRLWKMSYPENLMNRFLQIKEETGSLLLHITFTKI